MPNELVQSTATDITVPHIDLERANELHILLRHKSRSKKGMYITRLSLFDLHAHVTSLIFPKKVWRRTSEERIAGEPLLKYKDSQCDDQELKYVLEHIEKNRRYYRSSPKIREALDILENLARNYLTIQSAIKEKIAADDLEEFRKTFYDHCGDSTFYIIIGGSRFEAWVNTIAETTKRLFTRPSRIAPIANARMDRLES